LANQSAKGSMSADKRRATTKIATMSLINHKNHSPKKIRTALKNVDVEIVMV